MPGSLNVADSLLCLVIIFLKYLTNEVILISRPSVLSKSIIMLQKCYFCICSYTWLEVVIQLFMLLEMSNVTLVTTKTSITLIILCMIIEPFHSSENSTISQTHEDIFLEFRA